jgi:hypothetical protein
MNPKNDYKTNFGSSDGAMAIETATLKNGVVVPKTIVEQVVQKLLQAMNTYEGREAIKTVWWTLASTNDENVIRNLQDLLDIDMTDPDQKNVFSAAVNLNGSNLSLPSIWDPITGAHLKGEVY